MLKQGKTPGEMLANLQAARDQLGLEGPGKTAIYDFLADKTHQEQEERRGRPPQLTKRMLKVFDGARKKLVKAAGNEYLVTWEDVVEQGGKELRAKGLLSKSTPMWSADWISRNMREELDVRSRPAKKRIHRTAKEERARCKKGKIWMKKAKAFWVNDVTYIDSKAFVAARLAKQKKRMRKNRVVSHLRLPSEGVNPGFVAPKKNRILTGIKAVNVTAAVAKGRIIMWHVTTGPWNGAAAAVMYRDLGRALRKTFPAQRKYRVVEDGDPKGFQSGKGLRAKTEQKIESWTLPPRSPEWMPLDFCLWNEIEGRLYKDQTHTDETQKAFQKRLRRTALRVPRKLVNNVLGSVRKHILMTVKAKGKHIKTD